MADAVRELLFKIITQADVAGLDTVEKRAVAVEVALQHLEAEAAQVNATKVGPQADVTPMQLLQAKIREAGQDIEKINATPIKPKVDDSGPKTLAADIADIQRKVADDKLKIAPKVEASQVVAATQKVQELEKEEAKANAAVIKPKTDTANLQEFVDKMRQAERATKDAETAAGGLSSAFSAGLAGGIGGEITRQLAGLGGQIREVLTAGIQLQAQNESLTLSFAGLLRGADPGKFSSISAALGASSEAMEKLHQQASATAIPFSDLASFLQKISSTATSANIPLEKQITLVAELAGKGRELGLSNDQLVSQSRALLQGHIENENVLARSLGITEKDIQLKSAQGKAFEYLDQRLRGAAESNKLYAQTFEGLQAQVADELQKIGKEAAGPVFDALKVAMGALLKELADPGVREALKGIGYDLAEVVRAGSGLVGFLLQNADAFALAAKGIGLFGVALAALKIGEVVQALGAKAVRLIALQAPLAAATAQTNALAAAEERQALAAASAARAEGQRAGATTAAGSSSAGAGGAGSRIGGAFTIGAILGEGVALAIEAETRSLNRQADAAEAAGTAFSSYRQKVKDAAFNAPSFEKAVEDVTKLNAARTASIQQELDGYAKKIAAAEKLNQAAEQQAQRTGDIYIAAKALTTEEEIHKGILETTLVLLGKQRDSITQTVTTLRGAGRDAVRQLNDAESGQIDSLLQANEKRRISALSPGLQLQEYTAASDRLLEDVRQQLKAAGVVEDVVRKIKDVRSLENFATGNDRNQAGLIAAQQLGKLRDLDKERVDAAKAYAEEQAKAGGTIVELQKKLTDARTQDNALFQQQTDLQIQLTDAIAARRRLLEVPTDEKERLANTQAIADADKLIFDIQDKQRQTDLARGTVQATIKGEAQQVLDIQKKQTDQAKQQLDYLREQEKSIRDRIEKEKTDEGKAGLEKKLQENLDQQRNPGRTPEQARRAEAVRNALPPEVSIDPETGGIIYKGGAAGLKPPTVDRSTPGYTPPDTQTLVNYDGTDRLLPRTPLPSLSDAAKASIGDLFRGSLGFSNDFPQADIGAAANVGTVAESTKAAADQLNQKGGELKDASETLRRAVEENLPTTASATKSAADVAGSSLPEIATNTTELGNKITEGLGGVKEAFTKLDFKEGFEGLKDAVAQMNSDLRDAISSLRGQIVAVGQSAARTAAPSGAQWDSWTGAG